MNSKTLFSAIFVALASSGVVLAQPTDVIVVRTETAPSSFRSSAPPVPKVELFEDPEKAFAGFLIAGPGVVFDIPQEAFAGFLVTHLGVDAYLPIKDGDSFYDPLPQPKK